MRVVFIGATAALVRETIERCAAEGAALYLAARNPDKLRDVADAARAKGAASVFAAPVEMEQLDSLHALWRDAEARLGGVDAIVIATGVLPDEALCRRSPEAFDHAMRVNATAPAALASLAARDMTPGGVVVVVSSVAADRGRASNYAYGASKAALSTFLDGLGHEAAARGVRVVNVKPGMVDTPMTQHLQRSPAFADPKQVGARIHRALRDGSRTIYTPSWWRPAMWAIRALPRPLFERLNL